MEMKQAKQWALGLSCLLAGSSGWAAGFQLYTEGSAEALGQAAAVSGRDDLVSLAWYNPAALAGAEQSEIMVGSMLVQLDGSFSGGAGNAEMADDIRVIPHAYYVHPLAENVTFLLSINAPYGLISEWPDDWTANLAATYSDFSTIYTTPSVAVRLNDRFSLSAGFNVVAAEAELSASRDYSSLNPAWPDYGIRTIRGDDVRYGYTASAHGRFGETWGLGARFQSRVTVKLEGDVQFEHIPGTTYPVNATLVLPATATLGLVKELDPLTLGLDLVWTEWSTYDALTYYFGSNYPVSTLTPNPDETPKRWENVWSLRLGGEYALSDSWCLRGGYVWDQSPLIDATRAPELPGADRHMLTLGIGWQTGSIGLDLAYSYLWMENVQTGSEVVAKVPTSSGTYETSGQILGLSARVAF